MITVISSACTFSGVIPISKETIHESIQSVSIKTPYTTNRFITHQDAFIKVVHGASCAKARSAKSVDNAGKTSYGIGVTDSIPIPRPYDSATVFLNGWRLKYKSKDHEVLAMSTAIVDIEKTDNQLKWKAGGILSDKDGKDAFTWCYHYTVLMWKSGRLGLKATINDSDADQGLTFFTKSNNSIVQQNFNLTDLNELPGALLPRGFGAMRRDDYHIGTFGLKYGDPFIINSADGNHRILWKFESVFADKSYDDTTYIAELLSLFKGGSIRLIQPKFSLDINKPRGTPGKGIMDVMTRTITIDNIRFNYAVPMLTGWYIGGNSNTDSHIKDIGVWIESFNYSKDPNETFGKLTCTIKSVYHDKGSHGSGRPDFQISVLGFDHKPIVITTPIHDTDTVDESIPTL
jgi:hypothetical protein